MLSEEKEFEAMSLADLDRDEAEFFDQMGSIQHAEISFESTLRTAVIPPSFMPRDDNWLARLQQTSESEERTSQGPAGSLRGQLKYPASSTPNNGGSKQDLALPLSSSSHKRQRSPITYPSVIKSVPKIDDILQALRVARLKGIDQQQVAPRTLESELQILCSHNNLSFPSVQLGNSKIKAFILKNDHAKQLANLCLNLSENTPFKIIHENKIISQLNILIAPKNCSKIKILFWPNHIGQFSTHLIITNGIRPNNQHVNKKCIYLYGFGGRATLSIYSEYHFLNKLRTITLNYNFKGTFSVTNSGDSGGFLYVCIRQTHKEKYFSINPCFSKINPKQTRHIEISYTGEEGNAYRLLDKENDFTIKLCELKIIFGDESSRLRILRLYKRNQFKKQDILLPFKKDLEKMFGVQNLEQLKSNETSQSLAVDKLKDDIKDFECLFNDGIMRTYIDVVSSITTFASQSMEKIQFIELKDFSSSEDLEPDTS